MLEQRVSYTLRVIHTRPLAGFLLFGVVACSASDEPSTTGTNDVRLGCIEVCQVGRTLETSIGDLEGPGQVSGQTHLARGPDARYYLVSNFEPGIVKVFAPDGRFLTAAGRVGNAPGEFQSPWMVLPDTNGITIFDDAAMRVTRLTANLEHIETRNLRIRPVVAIQTDPGIYIVGAEPRPGSGTAPLNVYDWATDSITASFGNPGVDPDTRPPVERVRRLARGPEKSVWAGQLNRYRIERWDTRTGTLVQILERSVEWFQPWDRLDGLARQVPPPTSIRDLCQGPDGLLWVLMHTASVNWRPLPPARTMGGETYTGDAQFNELYDSIIEVIDPASRAVIASGRFPGYVLGFAGYSRIYQYTEDAAGNPRYEIYALHIER